MNKEERKALSALFHVAEWNIAEAKRRFIRTFRMQVTSKKVDQQLYQLVSRALSHNRKKSVAIPLEVAVALSLRSGAALGRKRGNPGTPEMHEERRRVNFGVIADLRVDKLRQSKRWQLRRIGEARRAVAEQMVGAMGIADADTFLKEWANWRKRQRRRDRRASHLKS